MSKLTKTPNYTFKIQKDFWFWSSVTRLKINGEWRDLSQLYIKDDNDPEGVNYINLALFVDCSPNLPEIINVGEIKQKIWDKKEAREKEIKYQELYPVLFSDPRFEDFKERTSRELKKGLHIYMRKKLQEMEITILNELEKFLAREIYQAIGDRLVEKITYVTTFLVLKNKVYTEIELKYAIYTSKEDSISKSEVGIDPELIDLGMVKKGSKAERIDQIAEMMALVGDENNVFFVGSPKLVNAVTKIPIFDPDNDLDIYQRSNFHDIRRIEEDIILDTEIVYRGTHKLVVESSHSK